ncbi:MAG: c-type cytochrome [Gammaproteobacteria bacterium]|nr:c-type cytochrome [Gammaproteobacteria bacterium]
MKRLIPFAAASLFALGFSSTSMADVEAMMADCNGCHGDNGISKWTDVPTIGGFPEFVHVDALYVYQDEARPCAESEYRQGDTSKPATTMCAIAAELSEGDIDAIAAAYAELPYVKAKQDFDAGLAAAGQALHEEHCDRCHSEAGTNPDDEAGLLGGQMMGYLATTMAQYQAGEREMPKKMKEKVDLLSADDVTALVNYYGSIQ